MATIQIAVINASTVLSDDDVRAVVGPLQTQVSEHFAPVWGVDANLTFVASGGSPVPGSWWLAILDNADQAGALGYHDITSEGLPLGKVFAETDIKSKSKWTVTASHELLEMLGDPDVNLTAFVQSGNTSGVLYAYEVCDACEADEFGYDIQGCTVSDFVYPTWFESFWKTGATQFDRQGLIHDPFELLAGGYIGYFDVTAGSGWQQKFAQTGARMYSMRPAVGSRRERRRTPRQDWLASAVRTPALAR